MGIDSIDWNTLWRECRNSRSNKGKGRADWDKKAASFARRNRGSSYSERLVDYIDPGPEETVLDIGAGPGTLALPLARRAKRVTALDFSEKMLEELQREAAAQGIDNIVVHHAAWEDDWQALGIPPHDIAVASRSMSVDDLEGALKKIDRWALRRVVITDRVGSGPFDPDVFRAVGRAFSPGPDYIYTVNILHRLGIYAGIDFMDAEFSKTYLSREEAVDSCLWMLEEINPEEQAAFDAFIESRLTRLEDGSWQLKRAHTPKWAVISWEKVQPEV
ncbi:MAG: class I SAM-dependent methyltransferase [Proteobacteria bacterium]|nr:class I SAM-dependent methyltransferase [Pseudomonadota bacterium]MBU1739400.1 class I SAM-dependent methyltransferase [Pseudomonadota bacterium]